MSRNQSVTKAFRIIEYLAASDGDVAIAKIARDLELDPATTFRFLASLKEIGYVAQAAGDGHYRLTLRFAWLSSQILDRIQLRNIARPLLEALAFGINESTHLAVLDGDEMTYIDKVESKQGMQMRSRVGGRARLYSTAVGKTLLAFLPKQQSEALLERLALTPLTKNTITNRAALKRQLGLIRSRGFAIDEEENEVGIRCLGAPIFDHTGCVVGAISISGWLLTMTASRLPSLALKLQEISSSVSRELGYTPSEAATQQKPSADKFSRPILHG